MYMTYQKKIEHSTTIRSTLKHSLKMAGPAAAARNRVLPLDRPA